jgi:hypothetical protein
MGNKAGMTSYFTGTGAQVPVTVIALLPGNVVTQARGPHAAHGPPGTQLPRQDAVGTKPGRVPALSGAPERACAAGRPAGCEPRRPSRGKAVRPAAPPLVSDLSPVFPAPSGEDARDGRLQRRPGGLQPDLRCQDQQAGVGPPGQVGGCATARAAGVPGASRSSARGAASQRRPAALLS